MFPGAVSRSEGRLEDFDGVPGADVAFARHRHLPDQRIEQLECFLWVQVVSPF